MRRNGASGILRMGLRLRALAPRCWRPGPEEPLRPAKARPSAFAMLQDSDSGSDAEEAAPPPRDEAVAARPRWQQRARVRAKFGRGLAEFGRAIP